MADDPGDDFLAKVLRDVGATDAQINEIFQKYMGQFMRGKLSEDEYWHAIQNDYNLTIPTDIPSKFMQWNGLVANDEVLALVKDLRLKGIKVAILSNVIEPTYTVLDNAGFYSLFDEVIASCKVGYAKPDSEIYERALRQLDTRAQEALFIDDKERNLEPARRIGMQTVLARTPEQIINDIMQCVS